MEPDSYTTEQVPWKCVPGLRPWVGNCGNHETRTDLDCAIFGIPCSQEKVPGVMTSRGSDLLCPATSPLTFQSTGSFVSCADQITRLLGIPKNRPVAEIGAWTKYAIVT
jgi:hypothetical protein